MVAGLAFAAIAPEPSGLALAIVAVAAVSALVPDVDHPSAPAANVLPPVSWLLCWALRNVSVRLTGTAHRGWTHSAAFSVLWGTTVAAGAVFWVPVPTAVWLGAAAGLGCLVGVLGDVLTVTGCAHVLWPSQVQVAMPHGLRFRTGGTAERFVLGALIAAGCLLLPAVDGQP